MRKCGCEVAASFLEPPKSHSVTPLTSLMCELSVWQTTVDVPAAVTLPARWHSVQLEVFTALYMGMTALTARTSSLSHSLATTGSRESEHPS